MRTSAAEAREVTALELIDRLLDKGIVLAGDITISVADVDLIFVGLKVMLASVDRAERLRWGLDGPRGPAAAASPRQVGTNGALPQQTTLDGAADG